MISVEHEDDCIFLCEREYLADTLTMQDILHSPGWDVWMRAAREIYDKPNRAGNAHAMLTSAGFGAEYSAVDDGMIVIIAWKGK